MKPGAVSLGMANTGENVFPEFSAGQSMSVSRMSQALDAIKNAAGAAAVTGALYSPPIQNEDRFVGALYARPGGSQWVEALQLADSRVLRSPTGVAAFRIDNVGLAVHPPFPLEDDRVTDEVDDNPLRSLLSARYLVGVAMVRLGRYAVGVYHGERLIVSKTDTRYVKGKHHAGGTSQRRFQRVRENQIHRLYVEAAQVVQKQWNPYLDRLDYVMLGGEASTVNGFVKECALLEQLAPITLQRRLDVREPNRASLDDVSKMLYQWRVYPLRWPE